MNKGIIMEVNKSYAITLNDEGIMDKIKSKQNMEVGQKIFYFEEDIITATSNKSYNLNYFLKAMGTVAALFILVFTFFNTMKYNQPYAVVSLDINPSIQIEADNKQMIIKVEGVNTDGKNLDFSAVKDIPLNDGIEKIKEKLREKNYLDNNQEVLVGFAFIKQDEDNNNYEETIKSAIESSFNTKKITYVEGDKKTVDEAKKKNISLGRYEAYLMADEETKNKIDKAPVKDITSSIKDKDNVTQWESIDEKITETPAVDAKPEEKSDNSGTNANTGKDKPTMNAQSDKTGVSVDSDKDDKSKPKNNEVIELVPDTPPVPPEKDKNQNPVDDKNVIISPENGTIENKPTSGKIEEAAQTETEKALPVLPETNSVIIDNKN